jgi:hypothetical protein
MHFFRRVTRLAAVALLLGTWGGAAALKAELAPLSVTLKAVNREDFAGLQPESVNSVKAAFKDKNFSLKEAANLNEVYSLLRVLSPEEERLLQKNRFLVLPKPRFWLYPEVDRGRHDEMLGNFDALGGSDDEAQRAPQNARFISPDVFLHAFYKYNASRLAALEKGVLRETARYMLAELYDNAARLGQGRSGPSAENWERLRAQLLVPLILIDNCAADPEAEETDRRKADSLENAWKRFEPYRPSFSRTLSRSVQSELERVYRAEGRGSGLLGLVAAGHDDGLIDYRAFTPRGRQAADSRSRAYYRAMIWLGRLGWDSASESGLADAMNCALAMSFSASSPEAAAGPPPAETPLPAPANALEAWARVMELSAFFGGYPESPSYQEWLPFLMKEAAVPEFTADTSADARVLAGVRVDSDSLTITRAHFRDLPWPKSGRVLSIFPARTALTRVIVQSLTQPDAQPTSRRIFSSLWLPVVLGQKYARDLLPRQLALTLGGGPGGPDAEKQNREREAALKRQLDELAGILQNTPEKDWFSSLRSAWLELFFSLAGEYDANYPLYMRSDAFPTLRLAGILGGLTELRHDPGPPPPSRPPLQAEKKRAALEEVPAPLVKGFIEPDPPFWRKMSRLVRHMMAGYQKYGLFPEDLEEYGALRRFSRRLERCAALAEKELSGEALSEYDYEFIRLFTLDWMAAPVGGHQAPGSPESARSALVVPVQALPPAAEGGRGAVIYEANADPAVILVLVGNEDSPRLTVGLVYNHFEFAAPFGHELDDALWRQAVYAGGDGSGEGPRGLPPRNFWYEPLRP